MASTMFGMSLDTAKRGFFDRDAVIDDTDEGTRKTFSRFGAFVRQRSRSSIRKRKKTSAPGQPPSSHTGLLKRFIFFSWDANERSVVIGPTLLNAKSRGRIIPQILEHGGRSESARTDRTFIVAPRPFMQPAFDTELDNLPRMWA